MNEFDVESYYSYALGELGKAAPESIVEWLSHWRNILEAALPRLETTLQLSVFEIRDDVSGILQEEENAQAILASDVASSCIALFSGILSLRIGRFPNRRLKEMNPMLMASASLLYYLKDNFDALRMLCLDHRDLPARTIARTVAEACDFMIALFSKPELCEGWINAQGDGNSFWHSNLSKSKLSKLRDKAIMESGIVELQSCKEIAEYRSSEFSDFSMAVHPVYQAGIMSIIQILSAADDVESGESEEAIPWASRRTLNYTTHSVALMLHYVLFKLCNCGETRNAILGADVQRVTPLERALFEGSLVATTMGSKGWCDEHLQHRISDFVRLG